MSLKLTQLTPHSWLMQVGSVYTGILHRSINEYTVLSNGNISRYNEKTLKQKYGKITYNEVEEAKSISTINGYPVKHDNINIVSEEPPLYTKNTSDIQFIAGYWCNRFKNGWNLVLCPKYSTVLENESSGPFKHRIEALNMITVLNNRSNLEID